MERAVDLGWDVTSLFLQPASDPTSSTVHAFAVDATDAAALREVLQGMAFEYVVNCAGYIDHSSFARGGRRVFETHFNTVVNLAEALERGPLRLFVNIGSSDEYGNNSAPQTETQREAPIAPYSLGKTAAAHFLQLLDRTEGFPATTLRLFLTYGPAQDARRLVPQVILGCLAGKPFPVSAGEQIRDFCYVRDTVDAVFAAFARPALTRGEVINVASGRPVRIRELIESVRNLVGGGSPQFGRIPYRIGENMELYADVSKAKTLLDWAPRVNLESGLTRTIQWFRDQH